MGKHTIARRGATGQSISVAAAVASMLLGLPCATAVADDADSGHDVVKRASESIRHTISVPGINRGTQGQGNTASGINEVVGDRSTGINIFRAGSGNSNVSHNYVYDYDTGGSARGTNVTVVGNNSSNSGVNSVGTYGVAGTKSVAEGTNLVVVGDRSADSGENFVATNVPGSRANGVNVAFVGNDTQGSGRSDVIDVERGSVRGFNLAFVGSGSTFSGKNSVENQIPDGRVTGINLAIVGRNSNFVGTNSVSNYGGGASTGINVALIGDGIDNAGNNSGGLINIAILPRSNTGNCTSGACVNLFGVQLLG